MSIQIMQLQHTQEKPTLRCPASERVHCITAPFMPNRYNVSKHTEHVIWV
jgi:hypothetical protein